MSFRAVILRFSNDAAHAAIERVMQQRTFSYAASIGATPRMYSVLSKESQRWFNSSDVRGGLYPDADPATLLPLDEELIERMQECQAMFMHMVSRLEQTTLISYDERTRMYFWHLRYWNDFLERHQINLLLAGILPHEIPDYVIYCLCRAKGIPTWVFHATTVRDTATIFSDIEDQAPEVRDRFHALQREAPQSVSLSPLFEEYWQKQIEPSGKVAISFKRPTTIDRIMKSVRSKGVRSGITFLRWVPLLLSVSAWRGRFHKASAWYRVRAFRRYYDRHAVRPDYTKPYVYVPLHFQPECSTCPMAGAFVDQLVTLQMLSREAPPGVLLYVKEHPVQRKKGFSCRSIRFYQELLAMPNVRLIEHAADTFTLREHCSVVATATGTAGFEAIFRGKPVLMFGHRFYQYAPGVFPIRTTQDCRDAISAVFKEHKKPAHHDVRLFLKAMEETCIHASVTDWHQLQASNLSFEDHVKAIAEGLIAKIGKE
ncbi:hypothetical protein FJZ27_05180 [Candidatus Peribacteria bacterium]|nr:hypothetical protein [Candidatus Peribacteria bacterium]